MALSRGNLQKKRKKNNSEETQSSSSCLLNENVFPGLNFLKNINNTKSTITTLKNRPNVVLSEKNIVIFDYSGVTNEKDLEILHATFSTMTPQTSKFILSSSRYVQDEFSIDIDIAGTFTFLNFMNGNLIVAKASSDLGNYDRTKWEGKFFIKTPQIEIFDKFSSSKNTDKVVNLIQEPNFKDWGIMVGDSIQFIGTKDNDDINSMVISINDEGTEMTLSELSKNENAIGLPVKVQHYRKCSSIETDVTYSPQEPIEVSSNKKKKSLQGVCPEGHHWMPDEQICMQGYIHAETNELPDTPTPPDVDTSSRPAPENRVTLSRTRTQTSTRTSTGMRGGRTSPPPTTPRTSTPRTSTPRTSTPRNTGGGY
tara:strand:- start:286 stop:1389 length:1104 start_codon:yes stop_codon:yes gene_type:complete